MVDVFRLHCYCCVSLIYCFHFTLWCLWLMFLGRICRYCCVLCVVYCCCADANRVTPKCWWWMVLVLLAPTSSRNNRRTQHSAYPSTLTHTAIPTRPPYARSFCADAHRLTVKRSHDYFRTQQDKNRRAAKAVASSWRFDQFKVSATLLIPTQHRSCASTW